MAANVLAAVRLMLAGNTSAGQNVSRSFAARPAGPYVVYRRDGGSRASADNRIDRARIVFHCYAPTHERAYALAMEVRAVLLPASRLVHGYRGWVGDTFVDNVEQDSGPSWVPDPEAGNEPRYVTSFLVTYGAFE